MMKILCLSFWTPPVVRPQAILIEKMIREWKKRGVEPVIVTYDICGDWNIGLPIYKIPQFSINKFLFRLPGSVSVFEWFYYRKLYRLAKKIIKEHGINLIFSFSNPQSSNILGVMLKKRLGIKFVSHFSDPWVDNDYKFYSGLALKKARFLEKYVVQGSDYIIFITERAKELVLKKYNKQIQQKGRAVPHCFDPEDYPKIQKDNPKFTIGYIGTFYQQRNPELLLEALGEINKKSEYAGKFQIKFVGCANEYAGYKMANLKSIINKNGLPDLVELIPVVAYKKSLEYMKLADCLVVIDANMPNSPFLTSKVVDYAGSGTPIVGITPSGSPTEMFLKDLGFSSFDYSQKNELGEHLEKLINGKIDTKPNQDILKMYEVKNTTDKLFKIFEEA